MNEVYFGDCMKGMPNVSDRYYDIGIIDPPYGLGNRLSDGGGKFKNTPMAVLYREKDWDVLPDALFWKEFFRVTKNQIVFGANYFLEHLPNTRGFICWDKKNEMPTMSACELIWTSYDKPAKIYRKNSMDLDRFHPTQKPISVYDYCLKYVKAEKGATIIDCFGGSMSSVISAMKNEMVITCYEIDEDYYSAGKKRIETYLSQGDLFSKPQVIFSNI